MRHVFYGVSFLVEIFMKDYRDLCRSRQEKGGGKMDNINKIKEKILLNLEEDKKEFQDTNERYNAKINEQAEIIENLIDSLNEIYHHYYEQQFYFAEISDKMRSTIGPILNFDNSTRELVQYNLERELIEVNKLNYEFKKTGDTKYLNYEQLVNKCDFDDIVSNLILNANLYKYYGKRQEDRIFKIENEIEKFTKSYQ